MATSGPWPRGRGAPMLRPAAAAGALRPLPPEPGDDEDGAYVPNKGPSNGFRNIPGVQVHNDACFGT